MPFYFLLIYRKWLIFAIYAKSFWVFREKLHSNYYNYYSNKKWSDPRSYDLCINSSKVGADGAVDVIMNFAKVKQAWNRQK